MIDRKLIIFESETSDDYKSLESPISTLKKMMDYFFEDKWKDISENPDHEHAIGIAQRIIYGMNKDSSEDFFKWFQIQHKFWEFKESSTRASIGNALEKLLSVSVGKDQTLEVGKKKKLRNKIIEGFINNYEFQKDIDLAIKKQNNHILLLQLRSKDGTGGTTAKASNVSVLKDLLERKNDIKKDSSCLYLIGVWDGKSTSQKNSMITNCYDAISHLIDNKFTKEFFLKNMEKGINLLPKLKLKLVYDYENIANEIDSWSESSKRGINIASYLKRNLSNVQEYDDFYLIFTCLSSELYNFYIKKIDNFYHLEQLLIDEKISNPIDKINYLSESNRLADKIFHKWDHVNNLTPHEPKSSDAKQYIRDLILIKFAYEHD